MLETKVDELTFITERTKTFLKKAQLNTVSDLLFTYPSRYEDYRLTETLENIDIANDHVVLEGSICSKITQTYLPSKMISTSFSIDCYIDKTNYRIRCSIFNRSYLKNKLKFGSVIRVSGKFFHNLDNFTANNLVIVDEMANDILPIYKVKDISANKYAEIIKRVFYDNEQYIKETLPKEIIDKYHFMSLKEVIEKMHFPLTIEDTQKAIDRLKYEELLQYQLSMKYLHKMRVETNKVDVIDYDQSLLDKLYKSLPYELTVDQYKVIGEILHDLKEPYPMNRLLQGEVGSGKTIVAFASILATVSANFQAVLMCPTEILAKQHFENIKTYLKDFPIIRPCLLVGSTSYKDRNKILQDIKNNEANVIIGTHAVFQKDVDYFHLGIVIADEEHRFGVRQRVMIKNKGEDVNYLKMSATPIPRSLAISAYGDTDISVIKTMPLFRKQVVTKLVKQEEKRDVFEHMKKMVASGKQIYVVTPLILESEKIDTANAVEVYEKMKKSFAGLCEVGLVHGKLTTAEKDEVILRFINKEIMILVATSVIEVGVNIENATTIIILGAERFGVATLHQLRGRVMRSSDTPYCFLMSDNLTANAASRLEMVENTTDGFKLAEYDLQNRGPGEFFGERQSGSMNFKYAQITDTNLLDKCNLDSEILINDDRLYNNEEYQYLYDVIKENYRLKTEIID